MHMLIICTLLSCVQFLLCLFTYYLCWIYVLEVRISIIIIPEYLRERNREKERIRVRCTIINLKS